MLTYIYVPDAVLGEQGDITIRSISEISSCLFGPKPWHIEIRHRVNKKHPQIICSDLRLSD